jgi:hypothetical protein
MKDKRHTVVNFGNELVGVRGDKGEGA